MHCQTNDEKMDNCETRRDESNYEDQAFSLPHFSDSSYDVIFFENVDEHKEIKNELWDMDDGVYDEVLSEFLSK